MRRSLTLALLKTTMVVSLVGFCPFIFAQSFVSNNDLNKERKTVVNTTHSEIKQAKFHGLHQHDPHAKKWMRTLKNFAIEHDGQDQNKIQKLKAEKWERKKVYAAANSSPVLSVNKMSAEVISMGNNFII